MRWSIIRSEPEYAPVSLSEAQQHVRMFLVGGENPEDELLESYIQAASDAAENYTQRFFAQRTITLKTDGLRSTMTLPVFPVLSVESIKYLDPDGAEQTLDPDDYLVDPNVIPAVIEIDELPDVKTQRNAVTIEVIAGYASDDSPPSADRIPRAVKQAILMATGHFFMNREEAVVGVSAATLPMAFKDLLWPYRVLGI